jgi:hypothetical protein
MRTFLTLFSSALLCSVALFAAPESVTTSPAEPCQGGVILDDGQVDSGYSFVPSASEGTYLQYFDSALFSRRELETICICWLKTRQDRKDVAFEVVFFEKVGNAPAAEPYAWVSAMADEVPDSVKTAGEFVEVDVRGVSLPESGGFIGVRWDPSEESFLFLCNDRSEETAKTEVYFHEDRARGWADVKTARDPIFKPHRAVMVRAKALAKDAEAPAPWKKPQIEKPVERSPSTLTAQPDASSPPRVKPSGG